MQEQSTIITSVVLQSSAYKLRKEFVQITIIIYKIAYFSCVCKVAAVLYFLCS